MIRHATHDDIAAMLVLGEVMHAESRYARFPWSAAKVEHLIRWLIDAQEGLALVAEHDGELIGGFLGSWSEHYFTTARVANDYAMFVAPGKRGGIAAARLLNAFVDWALMHEAIPQVGITTGVRHDFTARLYAAAGFAPVGQLFELTEGA